MSGNYNQIFSSETMKYRNYLLRCAFNLTKNKDDAEDLVQETYVRAYRFFHTFEPGSNCKSWMFKIMKNLFLNYLRKKRNSEAKTGRFEDHEYMLCYNPNYLENSIGDKAVVAINMIKDEYRMVLILFHLENYSLNDISEYLNWPLGTVKSRLHRARTELRNLLVN
jgi:RNA polymerase sigma-70 factor (ECF subfamily)